MQPDLLVIFETTGAYHPQLERALGTHSVSFVKVIPKQALRFAQASGKLAKTGRIDCEMLAKMGAALKLVPKPLPAENLYDLKKLLSERWVLIKDRTAAKARKATVFNPLVKQQLEKCLRQIESDITKIDALMLDLAHQNQLMRNRLDILFSIPSIGVVTALMILVDMPKIGAINSKQVASLAGLTLMSQSSGKWLGKALIPIPRNSDSAGIPKSVILCFIFQKSGLKPPTSVGKDPTVRRRRSKPLNPSTLVGGGSVLSKEICHGFICSTSH
jgi:transposase